MLSILPIFKTSMNTLICFYLLESGQIQIQFYTIPSWKYESYQKKSACIHMSSFPLYLLKVYRYQPQKGKRQKVRDS